ncbi:MAG: lipid kinase [Pseudomonadota bacterium]|nr:lipid kinase [Pseudomonadota bacterium]
MNKPCALLIYNPHARNGDNNLDAGIELLRRRGIEVLEATPSSASELAELCEQHRGRIDRVIAAGGDGTVNLALNGIFGLDLPLGVVPMGTANDFARTLELPSMIEDAFAQISEGRTVSVDVGEVNGHYFLNVAHIGFGVAVSHHLDSSLKRWLGPLSYLIAATSALRVLRRFHVTLRFNGQRMTMKTVQVAVGNGVFYGGGTPVAENARIDDAGLDLCVVPPQPWWRWLKVALALRTGSTHKLVDVFTQRVRAVEIDTTRPHTITADGEIIGKSPARFVCHPAALRVFASQTLPDKRIDQEAA